MLPGAVEGQLRRESQPISLSAGGEVVSERQLSSCTFVPGEAERISCASAAQHANGTMIAWAEKVISRFGDMQKAFRFIDVDKSGSLGALVLSPGGIRGRGSVQQDGGQVQVLEGWEGDE